MKDSSGTDQELLEKISALEQKIKDFEELEIERKGVEEYVRRGEEKYRRLFEIESDAIFLIDSETGNISEANNAAYSLYGYSARELIGKNSTDLSAEPERTRELAEKELETVPLRYHRKKDGTTFPVEITATHLTWDGRRMYLAAVRDISRRIEAEETLRRNEEEYRNIHDNAMVGIFQSTPEGKYLRVNPALAAIYGFSSPDEMIGTVTNIAEQVYVDPEDRKRYMKHLERGGAIRGFEVQLYRKDGSTKIWISMTARTIRHPDGSVAYYEGVVEDITERQRAEEALRWKTALFEAQVNASLDGILVVDENQKRLIINQRMIDLWGVPQHILDDEDDTALLDYVVGLVKDPGQFEKKVTYLYEHPDKTSRDEIEFKSGMVLDRYSAPVLGEDGHHYGRIWAFRDITESKRAEEELRESQRRLADIIEFLPDATLAIDQEGKVIAWNRAIEAMTGVMKEDMLGKGNYEYAIPFYATRRPILINFVSMWDEDIEKQYSFIKKDGDTLFTETNVPFVRGQNRMLWGKAGPLYDTRGNVIGAIESIRDITEREQSEQDLFNEKEKLRILSENAPFGMVLIDKNGKYLYINPKFKRIFGYDLIDIPDGRTWFRKAYPDQAFRHKAILTWLNDLSNADYGERRPWVYDVICKDGSTKVISFIPVHLGNGDSIVVCEDITERKKLEAQLMNAQKMEAIGTLSGGIAHDFNNILMGVQGYTSLMMLDVDRGHPHYEWLEHIEELIKNAADLTSQLLGFARGGKYVVKPFNVNDLIEKTSIMFGRTRKEVVIHRKYEKEPWAVEGDQGQIEQVFLNLYLNAWQAMPAGGDLSLETRNVVFDRSGAHMCSMMPGRYVCATISDTGVGMDAKTKERIFEPFFTTKELGRGTGLGLAMVYGIIKNHNGHIDVISEPGQGTRFVLYFPASGKDITEQKPAVPAIMKGTETILLVDDEPSVLQVSKAILESLGYTVYEVRNGEEAVSLYREMKDAIDLVVLDMVMPGLSGSETFDRIRELDPAARIILSSGYSLNDQAKQIMERGCKGFIQKPFGLTVISQKLREALEA